MKQSKIKNSFKQIICIIIVLVLCNFIIPNYSYAVSTEGGGSLLTAIAQMFCTIPDAVINCLQDMFVSSHKIQLSEENYKIEFAPGTIFAGKVPAFDINFIDPMEAKESVQYSNYVLIDNIKDGDIGNAFNRLKENVIEYGGFYPITHFADSIDNEYDKICNKYNYRIRDYKGEVSYKAINYNEWYGSNNFADAVDFVFDNLSKSNMFWIYEDTLYFMVFYSQDYITTYSVAYAIFETTLTEAELLAFENLEIKEDTKIKYYESSSKILQSVIATWYNALRRIALVGLLSVLVYIGIRIVLKSTSAKDKAKYKNMLKDWLVAICILFTLHYIMNITITVVDKVNEVIGSEVIGEEGEDILMSTVRNEIARGENWGTVLTYVVIYCVLVVFTIIFSIQYLKRVIYLAFLTAIAPLITLTYPLDKIKDSKSQAFDMWLKDYIFFSLLQVLHLLLYYILVGSSMDLTNKGNWIYALVAIGFLMPAEKTMKKMFGFEKSNSMGALAAGATGAFVMNAINKMSQGASKLGGKGKTGGDSGASSSEEAGTNTTVRTATTNPLAALTTAGMSSPSDSSESEDLAKGSASGEGSKVRSSSSIGRRKGRSSAKSHRGKKGGFIGGVKSVSGKYLGPTIKSVLRNASGGFFGLSGAIIGASAKLSQGDLEGVITGVVAGGIAGKNVGQGAVDFVTNAGKGIGKTVSDVRHTWNEGTLGEVEAANLKFDREFRKSSGYKALKDTPGFSDEKVQQMLDAGITDAKQMDKILKNNNKHPRKYSIDRAIAYSELAESCPLDIMYNNTQFIRYCQDRQIEITEEEIEKLRKCIIDFK